MKKILHKIEIVALYFEEHKNKTNLIGKVNGGTLRTINESSLHFISFKIKHFFLNQWKQFLNWCEVKFFPELAVPRFEKREIITTQTIEEKKEKQKEFKYMQRVVFISGFFEGLQGVVLGNHCFFGGKYEVQIIVKGEERIIEAWGSDMKIVEDKKKSSKS